ncbi:MAG: family 10 glycosylhydrolase [Cytophagales bacterium]|nr:family 10 glycosylhydrolase [Armatimonadota bacterium]
MALLGWGTARSQPISPVPDPNVPPVPRGEFRGVWVATVGNIDWPSRPGLSADQQKGELLGLLDQARRLNLNAFVFQVRPACDALYASPYEPWSEYLSGQQGKDPGYDPLAFAVGEAHKRGLELHAWFNPYRVRPAGTKGEAAASHISRTRPDLAKPYGKQLWLDPTEPATQDLTVKVVLDVVKRYDIDGVHLDDYFYPYPEQDAAKKNIPFPDDPAWNRYVQGGGMLSRSDWRRAQVDILVQRLAAGIKAVKPFVKFGISPFGIWRPGNPAQIKGFDSYEELYADAKKWLTEGWVDYLVPQLYWKIEQTPQSFPVLLSWWIGQNPQNRHIWAGLYTSRAQPGTSASTPWPAEEIAYQIRITRGMAGADGAVHFSAGMLRSPAITQTLKQGVYAQPAPLPASPWMSKERSSSATSLSARASATGPLLLSWRRGKGGSAPLKWVVQTRTAGKNWAFADLRMSDATSFAVPPTADAVAITPIDRIGNPGVAAVYFPPVTSVNRPAQKAGR